MDLYPLLPIGIGLAALGWLLRGSVRTAVLRSRGETAQGEVVGYQETSRSAKLIVRFHTEDDEEVLLTHDNTSWAAARRGDPVTVSYDPDNPARAHLVAAPWLSGWARGVFTVLAAGVLLIGGLFGFLAWT